MHIDKASLESHGSLPFLAKVEGRASAHEVLLFAFCLAEPLKVRRPRSALKSWSHFPQVGPVQGTIWSGRDIGYYIIFVPLVDRLNAVIIVNNKSNNCDTGLGEICKDEGWVRQKHSDTYVYALPICPSLLKVICLFKFKLTCGSRLDATRQSHPVQLSGR